MEYNAVTDFSTTQNPNGVWEYLCAGALLTTQGSNFTGAGWWNGLPYPNSGFMTLNQTGTIVWSGTHFFATDHLTLDPESNANVSVRFTAPSSGTYTLTGDFEAEEPTTQHAHPVEILVNGSPVFSDTISTTDQHDPFSIQATLTVGDTVDFAVETGPNGDLWDLGTGLAVVISSDLVHWAGGSGNFNTGTDWNPQVVPGATADAVIDAAGTYTVTVSTNETVDTLAMAANATLVASAGTFAVSNGSGAGGLAGNISLDTGAVLALAGAVVNTGTIAGAGQLGAGDLAFANSGTVNANASGGLTVDLGGESGQNLAGGLIEATATGGLTIASGTIDNAGTMLAANGGTLSFGSGAVNDNNSGGVLTGGAWEVSGGGTLAVTGGAVTVDKAAIILSGAGSGFSAGDGSSFTSLQASLVNVAPIGTLSLNAGAAFIAANTVSIFGTVALAGGALTAPGLLLGANGQVVGSGALADSAHPIWNYGTIDASAAAGLTLDPGPALSVQNLAGGLIEATAGGGLTVGNGAVNNAGAVLAANGSTLAFAPGVVNENNSGGVLSWGTFKWSGGVGVGGGTWEASGGGTLAITGGAVTTDRASIILSGAGSVFEAGNGSIFTGLQASLADIAPIGMLELDAGASVTASHAISVFGTIVLANGTLMAGGLALGSIGRVRGSGTIAETRNAILNGGTIEANGGTLAIATAVDAKSSGVFVLDAASVLEIAADQGASDTIRFLGAGELIVDAAGKFGLNVGGSAYTGPLVENFGTGDEILLKNVAPAGLVPDYDAATGIVQISNGTVDVATLAFDTATLGAGAFHIGDDGSGHAVLTHS